MTHIKYPNDLAPPTTHERNWQTPMPQDKNWQEEAILSIIECASKALDQISRRMSALLQLALTRAANAESKLAVSEAKLAKAVDALQEFCSHYPRGINPFLDDAHIKARAALAELEKTE